MLTERQAKIADHDLQNYLTRIAYKLSYDYSYGDPDELLSVMNEAIIERASSEPTFLDQAPGYISRFAAWKARDYARRERYGRNLAPVSIDAESDEDAPVAETLPAESSDLDLGLAVRDILAGLDEKLQTVARMLAAGFQKQEIAAELEVSGATVTYYVGKLQVAFAAAR